MGFMKPKIPSAPPPPPPAPTAPDLTAQQANRSRNFDAKAALGGTYLTQGLKLGGAPMGKSMLGL